MEKDKLAKRLSYIREKSCGLLDQYGLFRSRKLLQEAMLDMCNIMEELNEEIEKSKEPKDRK